MRILTVAITNPYRWPYVRRGSERILHDCGRYLQSKGFGVETYTMAPDAGSWHENTIEHHTLKQRFRMPLRQFNDCHYFAFALSAQLRNSRADIVHCLNYFDAYGAVVARRKYRLNYKIVFHAVGIPTAKYFRAVPLDWYFFYQTLKNADSVWVLSEFARHCLVRDFNKDAAIKPPPVALADAPSAVRVHGDVPVRLLFVGDCDEPRKGAALMMEAFVELKRIMPTATLSFSGNISRQTITRLLALPGADSVSGDVQFLGRGTVEDLPALYANATVTVLPSVWEAFGLVVIESLAQGTPVVGCRHAGIVDIIHSDDVGVLFDPELAGGIATNRQGLVDAIETLVAAITPETTEHCRQRASHFSWDALGPDYIRSYQALLAGEQN